MYQPEGYSLSIFKSRYALTSNETWSEACDRLARQMSSAEKSDKIDQYREHFFKILSENKFVPGGRIWYNSGRPNPQLLNCFLLTKDLDSKQGWGNLSREMIITSMTGGGCGCDFSEVRPHGAEINGQKGEAPGPLQLMHLINNNGYPVRAAGSRRVALMFSLDLTHTDIVEFIDAKMKNGELQLANISVRSKDTSGFINAILNDEEITLSWKGKYKKQIKAKELWNKIVENSYNFAEPGFLNWELALKESNTWYMEDLVSTNPCVSGDTEILTSEGYQRIDELVDTPVKVWNGFEWSDVTPKVTGHNQEMLTVTFNNGRILTCTKYHKFHISKNHKGDVEVVDAKDLKPGMKLIKHEFPIMDNMLDLENTVTNDDVSVVDIKDAGIAETVYCFNEPKRHLGIFNGVITGQCGEIALPEHGSCCLGHIVLPRFVDSNGQVNWHEMADTIRHAVRFLDNVLTVNHYPLPEMKEKSHKERRIGLGTTGLADMLLLVNLKYGSEEGNKFKDKLYKFIAKVSYETSIMLAIEKGMFPLCNPKLHAESGFIKRMPNKIRSLIKEHGIRNCCLLTQAPTGTVSILSGNCSSGIEPIFAAAYERRYWEKEERKVELIFHPLFKQFVDEGRSTNNFISARELSVREHMEVQTIVQRWVDNAVSKTINIPEDYPIDDMSKIWLEYLPKLKGTTFYRENTRGYVDEKGVIHEPPLKALTIEEANQKFAQLNEKKTGSEIDCTEDGLCNI